MATGDQARRGDARRDGKRRSASLAEDLRVTIMRISREIRTESSAGVTAGQHSVLAALSTLESATLRDLADREHVQPPAMTRTVAALAERGLVKRVEDPIDRRRLVVSLTPEGLAVLNETRERRTQWLALRVDELQPAERKILAQATEILQRMSAR
jgi:DNA-binding MarR family transcriptional regulator